MTREMGIRPTTKYLQIVKTLPWPSKRYQQQALGRKILPMTPLPPLPPPCLARKKTPSKRHNVMYGVPAETYGRATCDRNKSTSNVQGYPPWPTTVDSTRSYAHTTYGEIRAKTWDHPLRRPRTALMRSRNSIQHIVF